MASAGRSLQKLFVGNISWTVGHQELRDFFMQFGRVTQATVVFDKETGIPKGYGFVWFENSEPLKKLENNDRLILDGQYMTTQPTNE